MIENSFNEIKKLMKVVGGKVIIVENGKPTMVVIDIDEYIEFEKRDDLKGSDESSSLSDKKLVEKINKNINIWKNRQEERKLKQLEGNDYREMKKSLKNYGEKKGSGSEIVIERL